MNNSQEDVLREFREHCCKQGMRVTAPRLTVYRILKDNREHPGVDSVWKAAKEELPNISRESVYRILNDFVAHGVFAMLDRSNVVARYDSNPKRHDHFYCTRCGRVLDFELPQLPNLVATLAAKFGTVEHIEARVQGVCKRCLAQEQTCVSSLSETANERL